MQTFQELLDQAIQDFDTHGYDSAERLDGWLRQLQAAAERELMSPARLQERLTEALGAIYHRLVDRHQLMRPMYQAGEVGRYVPEMLKPALRRVQAQKVAAAAQLIKLNKEATVAEVLRRFAGWASSIPPGGLPADAPSSAREERQVLRGRFRDLPFEERRVIIDQGHKLTASLAETVALGHRAIAAKWHSHWRQLGYRYREDHKEMDEEVYVLREGWAYQQGLVTSGAGFIEDTIRPAEAPFCRCHYQWLYGLSVLPPELLTPAGVAWLARVRNR